MNTSKKTLLALGLAAVVASPAAAVDVTVTIENLAPSDGNYLTPVWVGFHDGTFDVYDVYDVGAPASAGLERIAEDGNSAPLSSSPAIASG